MSTDTIRNAIRILLLDNEHSVFASLAAGFLGDPLFAHTIDYAPTIAQCLQMITIQRYDIFIIRSRLHAEKESGLDLLHDLRAQGCKTPAILLTDDDTQRPCTQTCAENSISRCVPLGQQTPSLLISIIADTLLHFKKNN